MILLLKGSYLPKPAKLGLLPGGNFKYPAFQILQYLRSHVLNLNSYPSTQLWNFCLWNHNKTLLSRRQIRLICQWLLNSLSDEHVLNHLKRKALWSECLRVIFHDAVEIVLRNG
jgi:hypothetical protein